MIFRQGVFGINGGENKSLILTKCGNLLEQRLFRFALVGCVGFCIEAGLLTYFTTLTGIGPIKGRGISFPVAVLVTWWLNRNLTFQSENPPGLESMRYFFVQLVGAVSNLAVFAALASSSNILSQVPMFPLLIAAIVGLGVNFTLSSRMVFSINE
ncbi:MAG: GtrA family protein [Porticoccaceae bacterium]